MEIGHFFVMEHDGRSIGCAALYPFPDDRKAELACMAVHHAFRRGGRGDRLLKYSEEQAQKRGINMLFVLTTRTEHWFIERGFVRSEEHTSELQSLMRISYAVFCLKNKRQ